MSDVILNDVMQTENKKFDHRAYNLITLHNKHADLFRFFPYYFINLLIQQNPSNYNCLKSHTNTKQNKIDGIKI